MPPRPASACRSGSFISRSARSGCRPRDTRASRLRRGLLATLLALAGSSVAVRAQSTVDPQSLSLLKNMSLEDLMQIQVTSVTKYPEKLLDAAAAIQVVTAEDIRRSGSTTIADALRLADNLNVAQKDPHDWAISARGFNANVGDKLLVLFDGRSVYTPLFSGVFWNSQDYLLEDLDRIEVISGPGGTLWGANAVNGVINITSKNARDTQGTLVQAGVGTELQGITGVRYGGALGANSFFRIYGKYAAYDEGALASGAAAGDGWRQGQGGFRIDSSPSPDDTVTVQGDLYNGHLDIPATGVAQIGGGNALAHWTHLLGGDSDVSAKVYFDRTDLRDPFAASPFQPAGSLIDQLDTYDLELQHRFVLHQHQIVWGVGYRLTDDQISQQAPNFGFYPADLRQQLFSFFAQDEVKLLDQLTLTLGSKLEHNDYTGWEVEPTIRLRTNIADTHTVWAAVSRAVRTPSRFDRDLSEPSVAPVLISGSKTFASETVVTGELGYRGELARNLSASVSLFYNQYDDLRGLAPTPVTTLPFVWSNSLEADTYGAEIGVDLKVLPWWRLHAGYASLHEKIRIKDGRADVQNGLAETEDPENQLSLRSAMDLPHRFELDANFRWVDSLQTNNFSTPGTVPSYAELNLRLGWHPTDAVELSLVGQNLLHAHHPEYGFPGASREELQRGVYGKIVWRFK